MQIDKYASKARSKQTNIYIYIYRQMDGQIKREPSLTARSRPEKSGEHRCPQSIRIPLLNLSSLYCKALFSFPALFTSSLSHAQFTAFCVLLALAKKGKPHRLYYCSAVLFIGSFLLIRCLTFATFLSLQLCLHVRHTCFTCFQNSHPYP